MASSHVLPFKVGQQAESKSFEKGYRSAWFRCKINKLTQIYESVKALLEFYDYPGEKMHWTKLHQKPSKNSIRSMDEQKAQAAELILRPCFPPMYHEYQMPDLSTISDVVLIVDDVRKVGDLVDWWSDGCYWSGRVTHLLSRDKVQIVLPDPPVGEGKSYEAFCDDLRPSLDWSLDHGWTVPESETSRCCARLVWPQTKDVDGNENSTTLVSNATSFTSCKSHSSVSSARLASSLVVQKDNEQENYNLVEHRVCASCDTGTSGHSSIVVSSLPPTGHVNPHVDETSTHCSLGEDYEKEMEVQSTKTNLDVVDGTKEIASGLDKPSSTLDALLLLEANEICRPPSACNSPETNDTSMRSLGMGKICEEVQSMDMHVDTEDGKRQITNLLDKASGLHEPTSSLDTIKFSCGQDQYNFEQLRKRLRITENYHPTSIAEWKAIESSILELEELANKIKWLKGLIIFGLQWSNATKPSWKFSEM